MVNITQQGRWSLSCWTQSPGGSCAYTWICHEGKGDFPTPSGSALAENQRWRVGKGSCRVQVKGGAVNDMSAVPMSHCLKGEHPQGRGLRGTQKSWQTCQPGSARGNERDTGGTERLKKHQTKGWVGRDVEGESRDVKANQDPRWCLIYSSQTAPLPPL